MKRPENNTIKNVAVVGGVVLLAMWLFKKTGASDEIGGGVGDIFKNALGGIGDIIGGGAKGLLSGAGDVITNTAKGVGEGAGNLLTNVVWNAPAEAGSHYLAKFVNLTTGSNKGDTYARVGMEEINKHGLGVIFWSKDRITQDVMPHAQYSESMGRYDYIDERYGERYQSINALRAANEGTGLTIGDMAYQLAVQEGKDVSNWDLSKLSSGFRASIGR